MKKLIVVMMALGLAFGASAQRGHGGGGHVTVVRPRVVVGVGAYSPFYSPYYGLGFGFGYPFYPFGYSPYAPYGYGYGRESRLDLQIDDIKNDYRHQIKEVRQDKSVPRSERKAKIRDLKFQRDKDINQAKRDFYDRRRRPNTNQGNPSYKAPQQQPQQEQQPAPSSNQQG